ncbi:hypothetical protein HAP93_02220 [Acidithiobacillus ferriphilus]|uniref:hypothetical protein n=1 Tax=Acidithiobacillus ferriphilus TaxID=1689834 RepID=UPI001C063FF0|nr:hypothetical protein [Acidithiobacillus ferriphilus]MBU2784590.1 hypothetical protein [Acidithiobacillus ferriphilus]
MKMQTKASMARAMMLYLIITWMVPMVFEIFHLTNNLWLGMVAAVSPLPFVLFIVLINKSLAVKYYTQRASSIAMLVVANFAIVARVAMTGFPSVATLSLVEFVSFIGLFTSLYSLLRFSYEVLDY